MAYEVSDKIKKAYKAHEKKREMAKKMSGNYSDESPKVRYSKERSMVRHYEKSTGKSVSHEETAKNYKH